jgi:hypothetical protein
MLLHINTQCHTKSSTQHFIAQSSIRPDAPSATPTDLTFSSSMSDDDFFKWLRLKGMSEKDCKSLSGRYKLPLTIKY